MAAGVERTHVAVAGPRLAECEMNGAGSLTTSRPCSPIFTHRETERAGLRVAENGASRAAGSTPRPHTRWGARQTANPGLQCGEIKPQTSD